MLCCEDEGGSRRPEGLKAAGCEQRRPRPGAQERRRGCAKGRRCMAALRHESRGRGGLAAALPGQGALDYALDVVVLKLKFRPLCARR